MCGGWPQHCASMKLRDPSMQQCNCPEEGHHALIQAAGAADPRPFRTQRRVAATHLSAARTRCQQHAHAVSTCVSNLLSLQARGGASRRGRSAAYGGPYGGPYGGRYGRHATPDSCAGASETSPGTPGTPRHRRDPCCSIIKLVLLVRMPRVFFCSSRSKGGSKEDHSKAAQASSRRAE